MTLDGYERRLHELLDPLCLQVWQPLVLVFEDLLE